MPLEICDGAYRSSKLTKWDHCCFQKRAVMERGQDRAARGNGLGTRARSLRVSLRKSHTEHIESASTAESGHRADVPPSPRCATSGHATVALDRTGSGSPLLECNSMHNGPPCVRVRSRRSPNFQIQSVELVKAYLVGPGPCLFP